VLDDLGGHDRRERAVAKWQPALQLRARCVNASSQGRPEGRLRDVHTDNAWGIHHLPDELAVVAAYIQQPAARSGAEQQPQALRACDVEARRRPRVAKALLGEDLAIR